MPPQQGVIFDGDDTLWSTQPLYDAAKEQFFAQMVSIGMPEREVRERLDRVDIAAVKEHGFSRHRFPSSLLKTYRTMCLEHGVPVSPDMEQTVRAVGYRVLEGRPEPIKEANDVLRMVGEHYRLILATKGDRAVQASKVATSGLADFFTAVYILHTKADREFAEIVAKEHLIPASSWSVGNSLRSDIKPALRLGMNAIWLDRTTWAYETDNPPVSDRFHSATNLEEVASIMLA